MNTPTVPTDHPTVVQDNRDRPAKVHRDDLAAFGLVPEYPLADQNSWHDQPFEPENRRDGDSQDHREIA